MKRGLVLCVLACTQLLSARKVIVVGGGLAGYSAAIEAYRAGAFVTLLEKEPKTGGNSAKASSGMNAFATPPQARDGVKDSATLFVKDTLNSGQGKSDNVLVNILVNRSTDAWHFLAEFGVSLDVLCKSGGHSRARTHRTDAEQRPVISNVGRDIMHALATYVTSLHDERLRVLTKARVLGLLVTAGAVTGVKAEIDGAAQELAADGVVLATGGFAGQTGAGSMLARYAPAVAHLSTTNGAFANGDGIAFGQAVGAQVVDMDQVQIHPTGFVDPHAPTELRKFLAPESLRACGGILLDHAGKRFCNELATRDSVTQSIMRAGKPYGGDDAKPGPISVYLVLNEPAAQQFSPKMLAFYEKIGLVQRFGDAAALAHYLFIDSAIITQEFAAYAAAATQGRDAFGKTTFPVLFDAQQPLYGMLITPCLHYCMGGLKFDVHARVLDANNQPIKGLFAAGEVTGGVHGANRLCGNSLLECVVFGRIAGTNAAQLN